MQNRKWVDLLSIKIGSAVRNGLGLIAIGVMVSGVPGSALAQAVGPDLVITAMSGPSQAVRGTVITGTLTVRNQGTEGTLFFQNGFYLSDSPTLTGWNILLDYQGVPNGLPAGASYSDIDSHITIPATSPTGNMYLVVKADRYLVNGVIAETNESNNTMAQPIRILKK